MVIEFEIPEQFKMEFAFNWSAIQCLQWPRLLWSRLRIAQETYYGDQIGYAISPVRIFWNKKISYNLQYQQ